MDDLKSEKTISPYEMLYLTELVILERRRFRKFAFNTPYLRKLLGECTLVK